jgi:hypothetical protein
MSRNAYKDIWYNLFLEGTTEVVFYADVERCDYGVARSPIWYEIDPNTIDFDEIWFLGKNYTQGQFYMKFGKKGADTIINELIAMLPQDPDEWEKCE